MNAKKKTLWTAVWYLFLFAFLYIWFTRVHPLVVFDADDWTYLPLDREAWPILGEWNPAKVFPEVFMPLCSTVGCYLLMPLIRDYITVMTVTHGFVVSVFITVYLYHLAQLLKRLFRLDSWSEFYAAGLFLVLHFLALRSRETGNTYLLYSKDITCYYNYLIPGLLNGSIVCWIIRNAAFEEFLHSDRYGWKGLFFLAVFMAIFSNLVDSVILAVYAGSVLLVDFLKQLKKPDFREYLKSHTFCLGIFGTWLISAVFELSGGRAVASASGSLFSRLRDCAYCLLQVLKSCNPLFLVLCAVIVAAALAAYLRSRETDRLLPDLCLIFCVGIAAMVFCIVLLCAVVDPAYMYRAEYLFPIFFYCLMPVMLCAGYLLHKFPKLLIIMPMLLMVLASEADTKPETFLESNTGNLDAGVSADISRDLIAQVVSACEAGEKEMVLYVPLWDTENNWPHATSLMGRIRYALYAHDIIDYPIAITVVPCAEINEAHNLETPAIYPG